jgi:flagellar biosynthesis chaperone FliJ
MKTTRNSDRLREILFATRHQIVSLKDIQMDMMRYDVKVANQVATQISALEEVYKHQLSLVTLAENVEPKRNGWFSGHIKTKEDRLANIMD